jgi:peptide deformylase
MIYELVPKDDPILKTKLEKFDFSNPPTDPIQLSKDMAETMIHYNGLGLAANQLGFPYNVFVMRSNPIYACFNAKIIDQSDEEVLLDEGCLTFPNLFLKIKRPRIIKVRFALPNGEVQTHTWNDMTARIFQHELDHINGCLYTSKVSKLDLERARNKMKKRNKEN